MTNSTAPGSNWNPSEFWTTQDYETSARLHLQHWIWQYTLGYAIHPKIPLHTPDKTSLEIADVAVGNGAWILEVNRSHQRSPTSSTTSITFHGFDITPSHFPAASFLPSNIHLHTWDALTPVPQEFVGTFDIVHIRAIYSVIANNAVDPLLSNLLTLLKPGGYLQWEENDPTTLRCTVPVPAPTSDPASETENAEPHATRALIHIQSLFLAQSRLSPEWLYNLPDTLSSRGCRILANERHPPAPELARAWTDDMLAVWKDVIPLVPEAEFPLPPVAEKEAKGLVAVPEKLSRRVFAELYLQAARETGVGKGVGAAVGMEMRVVVARKGV